MTTRTLFTPDAVEPVGVHRPPARSACAALTAMSEADGSHGIRVRSRPHTPTPEHSPSPT